MKWMRITSAVLVVLSVTMALAQARPNYDPQGAKQSQRQDGFIDSILKRVNPSGTDYGLKMNEYRKVAVESTVERAYFWTTLTCLVVIAFLILNWIMDKGERKRRELIAARFLTWYHNELVSARQTALDAVQKHERLQQFIDAQGDAKPPIRAAETAPPMTAVTTQAGTQITAHEGHALVSEINLLRQTVTAQQQQIVRLQKQLSEERQYNRARKGAPSAPPRQQGISNVKE